MPIWQSGCPRCKQLLEWYASNRQIPDPRCPKCKTQMRRLISGFAAIWTKNISDYGDKRKETFNSDVKRGGHWVYRKRSGGGTMDKPIPEFVTSVAQQKSYCREEGLLNPNEIGNMEMDASGTRPSTSGLPGAWV